jgi:hypothetical protein
MRDAHAAAPGLTLPPHRLPRSDLLDLTKLKDHVRESSCVLLLQTRSVLSRPWCLIELITAIDADVPIVGISITSGAFPYDFARGLEWMTHLDTVLDADKRAQLAALGLDLTDAAFKLSHSAYILRRCL